MPPSGYMAGLYARIDASRGVWKAPAGTEASLNGVVGLAVELNDVQHGNLNPMGVNVIRRFPAAGVVAFGARTISSDPEWKYVPVRRTAIMLRVSIYNGIQWAVFEPNDEPLWSQLRLNIGSFMMTLFRQGAFQGSTPSQAFFVKCDAETTTQADIDLGIVNILVGFAPLKPAEFVVVKISQKAGQASCVMALATERRIAHGQVYRQQHPIRSLPGLQVQDQVGWQVRGRPEQVRRPQADHRGHALV